MTPARASRRAGFTLLEVLLVLVVLALAAAISAPLLRKPARAQLQADATRVAAALRVTRAAAMAQNRPMDFSIDAARRTYASPVIPVSALDPRVDVAMAASGRASAAHGGVRFFPSGRSTGADIRLRLEAVEARVQVSWATGHVFIGE